MSADELQELKEHAEHAQHDPSMAPVSLTMAVLAVLVAVASLLGHRSHTEELVRQTEWADKWAHYQAKNIREHEDVLFTDLMSVAASNDASAAAKLREKYSQEAERYGQDKKNLEEEARELEQEVTMERNRANRYDLAEVFLEIALVITSITLLSRKRLFWQLGIVVGVVGIVVAATGVMIR